MSNVSGNSSGNVTYRSGGYGCSGSSNNSSVGKGGNGKLLRAEKPFDACVIACVKTALAADDAQAPALVRVLPLPGSTDVPPMLGIAVSLFFEPVVLTTQEFKFCTPETSYPTNLFTNDT